LDQVRRDWFDGQLQDWIDQDDVRGVTSNPSIFNAAISKTGWYDEQLADLAGQGLSTEEIYDRLTLHDIQVACDIFRPVYESTRGLDGYVSHEVSPRLAYDTDGTIREVRRLWQAVGRRNVLIKIPATEQGIPAIRTCLSEGINVNITLMFSLDHYDAVADAYLGALEDRAETGEPLGMVASVASFFVSRVDSHVDARLDERRADLPDASPQAEKLRELRGKAGVANSKQAYRRFREVFGGQRYEVLESHGAQLQRVLWASTSTKDPAYSDVLYVDELIGPHTVNTLPLSTLEAFRDHGQVAETVTEDLAEADRVVAQLEELGIDLLEVGEVLSREGVDKFAAALDSVLETVDEKRQQAVGS
jgi:transaldolase